jgi:hypothetical protein
MQPDKRRPGPLGGGTGPGMRSDDDTRYSAHLAEAPSVLRFPAHPSRTAPRSRPRVPSLAERAAGLATDLDAIARDPASANPRTLAALALQARRVAEASR